MFTSMIPYRNNNAVSNTTGGWLDDPFFRTVFNNDFFGSVPQMKVDVQDRGNDYLMEVELPGVKQDEIDLSLEDGVMTIKAEMNSETKEEKKEYLFSRVWGSDSDSELQTLHVHINRLRSKLGDDPKHAKRLLTVWGVGYKFI